MLGCKGLRLPQRVSVAWQYSMGEESEGLRFELLLKFKIMFCAHKEFKKASFFNIELLPGTFLRP